MVVLRRFLLCTKWIDCNSSLSSGMDALQNQIPMPSLPWGPAQPVPFLSDWAFDQCCSDKAAVGGENKNVIQSPNSGRWLIQSCGYLRDTTAQFFPVFFSASTGTWQDGRLHLSRDPIRVILLCCECKTIHNIITVRIDACNGRMNSSCDVWHCTWIGCYLQNSCSLDSRKLVLFSLQFTCKLSL